MHIIFDPYIVIVVVAYAPSQTSSPSTGGWGGANFCGWYAAGTDNGSQGGGEERKNVSVSKAVYLHFPRAVRCYPPTPPQSLAPAYRWLHCSAGTYKYTRAISKSSTPRTSRGILFSCQVLRQTESVQLRYVDEWPRNLKLGYFVPQNSSA